MLSAFKFTVKEGLNKAVRFKKLAIKIISGNIKNRITMQISKIQRKMVLIDAKICIYRISLLIRRSFFSFQNNPKDLDPSCKMDLDLWDCLGRAKLVLKQNFIGLI